jgi:hypothetical protein
LFLSDGVFAQQERRDPDHVLREFVVVSLARPGAHPERASGNQDQFEGYAVAEVFRELLRAAGLTLDDVSLLVHGYYLKLEFLSEKHGSITSSFSTPHLPEGSLEAFGKGLTCGFPQVW